MATRFCILPELFVIPVPLIVKLEPGLGLIVNALAPALKMIPFTSAVAESEIAVMLEAAKVARSAGALGTVAGVQFAAVFQSPLVGLRFQVALPAMPLGARIKENVVLAKIKRERERDFIS